LLDDARQGGRVLADALGSALGERVTEMEGTIAFGGWLDDACPVLIILMHRTHLEHGSAMKKLRSKAARTFATWLLKATDADCVAATCFHNSLRIEVRSSKADPS
jgi:hypothetical protein